MQKQTPLMDFSYFEQLFSPYPNFSITNVRPAYFDPTLQVWHVFRYTEVQRILSDYKLFSTSRDSVYPTIEAIEDPINSSMMNQDPPNHTRQRKLVHHAFTSRIASMIHEVRPTVENLLFRVKEQGHMDVVNDLANPWAATIIAKLLGIPTEDHLQFVKMSFDYINFMTPESKLATGQLIEYFENLVKDRLQYPHEDLISHLLTAEIDGERLTLQELIGICMSFIVAGHAPGPLLTNTILAFDAFPDVQPALRSHPEKIPGAIEEVMRFFAPAVSVIPRIVLEDTIIDEQIIPKGSLVVPWMSAANRDADQFANPATFDIQRAPNRHLTFGFGIHFCVGAPLARLETKIALEVILQYLQNITLDYSTPLVRLESPLIFSVKHAPITFDS